MSRISKRQACALALAAVLVGLGASQLLSSEAAESPNGPAATPTPSADGGPRLRAFSADSWWNAPLPVNAPTSPDAERTLAYMRSGRDAGGGCLSLAGTEGNRWGQPVFWAKAGDPEFNVHVRTPSPRPEELKNLRIPQAAEAARTSDQAMTLFDLERGYVVAFTGARYQEARGTWRARGATVTYLDSNGLNVGTGRSDDPRNIGSHRGNNGATMMVRYDEVVRGDIGHVLKVSSGPETSRHWVFPMVGSDGSSSDPDAPRQGVRFRIKPSVDLDALDLHPQAQVIAVALQRFGMYLGDNAGRTALKLEDTRAAGQGQAWRLSSTALCSLPFTSRYWDVIEEGYDPSR